MSNVFDSVEFGGSKQKVLNAVFSTMVDAYIDRFIVAALHGSNTALKLKLFEKYDQAVFAGKPNPLCFTLTGLLTGK